MVVKLLEASFEAGSATLTEFYEDCCMGDYSLGVGFAFKEQPGSERELAVADKDSKPRIKYTEHLGRKMSCCLESSCLNNKEVEQNMKRTVCNNMQLEATYEDRSEFSTKSDKKVQRMFSCHDSDDCAKWSPYHITLSFGIVCQYLFPDEYQSVFEREVPALWGCNREIPFSEKVRLARLKNNYPKDFMTESEIFLLNRLEDGQATIKHVIDMMQGIPHNLSDLYGNVCHAYALHISKKVTEIKFKELELVVTGDFTSTSDDHGASFVYRVESSEQLDNSKKK
jgi:hypothetical protein